MEEEVEILDSYNEIPELAEIAQARVPVQRIIINGEEQIAYETACAIICPKCRTIIQQFQPGVSPVEILKSINTDDEELLGKTIRCSCCGQTLKIFRPMPVEVDYEKTNSESVR